MSKQTFAITGYPLGHTMSPPIHKALFALSGRDAEYIVREVPPESVDTDYPALLKECSGFNVTIPHKLNIIPFLDKLADSAKRYGAVNVVKCADGEETVGYNTDVDGFVRSIENMGTSLSAGDLLLLGCGGVGRMIAIEAALEGASEVTLAVRESDIPAAHELKKDIQAASPNTLVTVTLLSEIKGHHHLMVNATPVGMFPHTDVAPVEAEVLTQVDYLMDVIYNPTETLLMKYAKAAGVPCCGGMSMLVWQAVVAHEIWDGDTYQKEDIDALVKQMEAQLNAKE